MPNCDVTTIVNSISDAASTCNRTTTATTSVNTVSISLAIVVSKDKSDARDNYATRL